MFPRRAARDHPMPRPAASAAHSHSHVGRRNIELPAETFFDGVGSIYL